MKKILSIAVFLLVFVALFSISAQAKQKPDFKSSDVIGISTTAFIPNSLGTSIEAVNGTLTGVEYIPVGDYKVQITNCNSLKTDTFSKMSCTINDKIDRIDYTQDDVAVLSTAFILNGQAHNKMGMYYGCTKVLPGDGYKVIIRNGKNKTYWNSLKCTVK